jgi:hypothetical protein
MTPNYGITRVAGCLCTPPAQPATRVAAGSIPQIPSSFRTLPNQGSNLLTAIDI